MYVNLRDKLFSSRYSKLLMNHYGSPIAFEQVQYVDLHNNHLSGPLPDSWAYMTAAVFLSLSYNSLTGSLPSNWSTLYEVCICPFWLSCATAVGALVSQSNACKTGDTVRQA